MPVRHICEQGDLLLLSFLLCFVLTAAAGSQPRVVMGDFSEGALFDLHGGPAALSPDRKTLTVDTTASTASYSWVFRTRRGVLKPGGNYVATFRYRVAEPDMRRKYFHVLCRPLSAASSSSDSMRHNLGISSEFRPVRLRFRTGEGAEDYAFQIHVFQQLKGEITDFRLVEAENEVFIPIATDYGVPGGGEDLPPTGAKEFEVELPRSRNGAVVDAAGFGVSSEAPDNTAALNRAIAHCRAAGAAELRIAPGVYRMTADASIRFPELRDFTFDGGGATFVFHKKREPNFLIRACERLLLCNFKVDWDWERDPLASLVEVAGAADGAVDFRFPEYERFPQREIRVARVTSYDPATKSVGVENGFDVSYEFYAGRNRPDTEWLSGNVLRLRDKGGTKQFRPGQRFRMQHYNYDMHGFVMVGNRHLTVEDVRVFSCAGHAFHISGGQQYWQFRRVHIAPPEGTPRRIITCAADHCHIAGSRGFFKMEECEFSFGGDDCLNAHDNSGYAVKSGSHSLVSRFGGGRFKTGDPVELRHDDFSPAGFSAEIRKVRIIDRAAGSYEFTFDGVLPEPEGEGFVLFNRTSDTRNLIIRNCFFHDNRARGLLLLGRDITVENNRFRHNDMGAIKIESGYSAKWSEGYGADNIVIRNNHFDAVNPRGAASDGKARDIHIGVYLGSDPSAVRTDYPILSNILLEGNTFRDSFGLAAFISSAGNVTIRDNLFLNPTPRRKPLPYRGGFHVTNARNIRITGNRYLASPLVPEPGVSYDPGSVRELLISGNTIVNDQSLSSPTRSMEK